MTKKFASTLEKAFHFLTLFLSLSFYLAPSPQDKAKLRKKITSKEKEKKRRTELPDANGRLTIHKDNIVKTEDSETEAAAPRKLLYKIGKGKKPKLLIELEQVNIAFIVFSQYSGTLHISH